MFENQKGDFSGGCCFVQVEFSATIIPSFTLSGFVAAFQGGWVLFVLICAHLKLEVFREAHPCVLCSVPDIILVIVSLSAGLLNSQC